MANINALMAEIEALTPARKLRLAADLVDNGKSEMARAVAERAVVELAQVEMDRLKQALSDASGGR